ncbi:PD-(D/E)XK nuclease family transposase [Butyrivibrio sp. WCE2006]|uniref:PD-(D/E)XK nuclease family transposase n=1 Tax=Butyrivibrio sp. WCE2006 TaxID=1410611 RepID=UPI0005D20D17|nr:PD-(D/E)XK nuclease family transposase [Butyrivibrio sp. WCE2006]
MTQNNNNISLRAEIINNMDLSPDIKKLLVSIVDGHALVPLTTDVMAKRIFSPDLHPERFDFLMQRIMKDDTLVTKSPASNETLLDNMESKRLIFDMSSWITDGRYANLEFQSVAQEFIFNRADIHSSRMLMMLYSADCRKKDTVNYKNVKSAVVVILMKNSPKAFKEFNSTRYIHRIKTATSDTGMEFPLLRQIAFVQLDKALEQFLNKTYNQDEDLELLAILAIIADINNRSVYDATSNSPFIKNIYEDAEIFSQDREVQRMTFESELNTVFYDMEMQGAEQRGVQEGIKRGIDFTNDLYSWLYSNNRDDDVKKASFDSDYREKLFEEYRSKHSDNNIEA